MRKAIHNALLIITVNHYIYLQLITIYIISWKSSEAMI